MANHTGRGGGARSRTKSRAAALAILDEIVQEDDSKILIQQALRQQLRDDPKVFWRDFVVPLLPKEQRLLGADDDSPLTMRIEQAVPPTAKKVKPKQVK